MSSAVVSYVDVNVILTISTKHHSRGGGGRGVAGMFRGHFVQNQSVIVQIL